MSASTLHTGLNQNNGDAGISIAEVPMHSEVDEQKLLGDLMLSGEQLAKVDPALTVDTFYCDPHRRIFAAILDLSAKGQPFNLVTVSEKLECDGDLQNVGGWQYLEQLASTAGDSGFYAEHHSRRIVQLHQRREFIRRHQHLAVKGRDRSLTVDELLAEERDGLARSIVTVSDRFDWMTAAQLAEAQFNQEYLIPGVLAAGQLAGIYGAFKSLKTSIAIDLLISLAIGRRFLGHFTVPTPVPTAFMSGESSLKDVQSTAQRICHASGFSLGSVGAMFSITPTLPTLGDPADIRRIGAKIQTEGIKALAIDPAYLCMDIGDDAGNLFLVGKFLRPLIELCKSLGCTIIIVHHNKRSVPNRTAPAELSDIAWSGFAEASAQWILLSRRREFDPETGEHALWMNVGGRAGHCGLYGVDVREGRHDDMGGRVWQVAVQTGTEARAAASDATEDQKESKAEQKREQALVRDRGKVQEAMILLPDGETARMISAHAKIRYERALPAIMLLKTQGVVEECEVKKGKQSWPGYRLTKRWCDLLRQGATNRDQKPGRTGGEGGATHTTPERGVSHTHTTHPTEETPALDFESVAPLMEREPGDEDAW